MAPTRLTISHRQTSISPVRVVIGGDTYFGEYYQTKRERAGKPNYLKSRGYDYCLERIRPLLATGDCVVVNLESALTEQTRSKLEGKKGWILAGDPAKTIAALKRTNVTVAMLGNNHAMDYGKSALLETIEHLKASGITPIGAGRNRSVARRPFKQTVNVGGRQFKLAIVSAFHFNEFHKNLKFYAGKNRPGVNQLDIPSLEKQVARLKKDGYFVIVSPHWGQNFFMRNHSQATLANGLIQAGADLVVGHGPHMLNELLQQRGVWVVYSVGNLVFNSEGEYAARQVLPYSLIVELVVEPDGSGDRLTLNLYPIVSCNQLTAFQPRFVNEAQFEQIAAALRALQYNPSYFDRSIDLQLVDGRYCFSVRLLPSTGQSPNRPEPSASNGPSQAGFA